MLTKLDMKFSVEEANRIREIAGALDFSEHKATRPTADQFVPIVHQIYGQHRDGKPMNKVFEESERRWRRVCVNMGARYIRWDADQCDALIMQFYPHFLPTYRDFRFAHVMRTDFVRFAILHRYGGMYSDLDVFPNRDTYLMVPFGVGKCPHIIEKRGFLYEMEIIVAEQGHPELVQYMECQRDRVARTPYHEGFYRHKVVRYILNTTGPYNFTRFLKGAASRARVTAYARGYAMYDTAYEYAASSNGLATLSMNRFDLDVPPRERCRYDVITHTSQSFFTKEFEVCVDLGDGQATLPEVPQRIERRRVYSKQPETKYRRLSTGAEPTSHALGSAHADSIASGSGPPTPTERGPPDRRPADSAKDDDQDKDNEDHEAADREALCFAMVSRDRARDELKETTALNREWVDFFHKHRFTTAARVLQPEMPESMQSAIQAFEHEMTMASDAAADALR